MPTTTLRVMWLTCCAGAILGGIVPCAADENKPASPPAALQPVPDEATIAAWISQLDSDSYAEREAASRSLAQAGSAAAPGVIAACRGDNLEVTTRSVGILLEMYRSEDIAAVDAAEAGLEKLLESPSPAVTQRVSLALNANVHIRQQRAVAAFEKLGGRIAYQRSLLPDDPDATPPLRVSAPALQHAILTKNWQGGDNGLEYLKRLPGLPTLYVTKAAQSKVSPEALRDLAQAIPELSVQERGDAYLGVGGGAGTEGCLIATVEPGSAADKAGLQQGDLIVAFDDKEIKDFNEMIACIKDKSSGEKVAVKVIRGSEVVTKNVVLGEWTGASGSEPPKPSIENVPPIRPKPPTIRLKPPTRTPSP